MMEQADVARVVSAYGAAARRCQEGQLDGCELLGSGHLLGQFLSPMVNQRTDAYGGDRRRLVLEPVHALLRRHHADRLVAAVDRQPRLCTPVVLVLDGVVSRKRQIVPALQRTLRDREAP